MRWPALLLFVVGCAAAKYAERDTYVPYEIGRAWTYSIEEKGQDPFTLATRVLGHDVRALGTERNVEFRMAYGRLAGMDQDVTKSIVAMASSGPRELVFNAWTWSIEHTPPIPLMPTSFEPGMKTKWKGVVEYRDTALRNHSGDQRGRHPARRDAGRRPRLHPCAHRVRRGAIWRCAAGSLPGSASSRSRSPARRAGPWRRLSRTRQRIAERRSPGHHALHPAPLRSRRLRHQGRSAARFGDPDEQSSVPAARAEQEELGLGSSSRRRSG